MADIELIDILREAEKKMGESRIPLPPQGRVSFGSKLNGYNGMMKPFVQRYEMDIERYIGWVLEGELKHIPDYMKDDLMSTIKWEEIKLSESDLSFVKASSELNQTMREWLEKEQREMVRMLKGEKDGVLSTDNG